MQSLHHLPPGFGKLHASHWSGQHPKRGQILSGEVAYDMDALCASWSGWRANIISLWMMTLFLFCFYLCRFLFHWQTNGVGFWPWSGWSQSVETSTGARTCMRNFPRSCWLLSQTRAVWSGRSTSYTRWQRPTEHMHTTAGGKLLLTFETVTMDSAISSLSNKQG